MHSILGPNSNKTIQSKLIRYPDQEEIQIWTYGSLKAYENQNLQMGAAFFF